MSAKTTNSYSALTKTANNLDSKYGGGNKQYKSFQTFGDSSNYKSTMKMEFRGQDKKSYPAMGDNPNIRDEDRDKDDDYIFNLQQQIHFMSLELKILKEKVIEDEKNSGIGSIYDDERNMHLHIHLLKTKYQKMRRDYDKELEELRKRQLHVQNEQHQLDAQLSAIGKQITYIENLIALFRKKEKSEKAKLETEVKQKTAETRDLRDEIARLTRERGNAENIRYKNTLRILFDKTAEEIRERRHDTNQSNTKKLLEKKEQSKEQHDGDLNQVENDFLAMGELQKNLADQEELNEKIELAKVEEEKLRIKVEMLESSSKYLNVQHDELQDFRNELEVGLEDNRKKWNQQEEIARKRMKQKLQKDNNPELKEMQASCDMVNQLQLDTADKLKEEGVKYDTLTRENMTMAEDLSMVKAQLEQDTEAVEVQIEKIAELDDKIKGDEEIVLIRSKEHREKSKINKLESDKNRKLVQQNAALKATLSFIKENYDYKTNVKKIQQVVLEGITRQNENVNTTVHEFVSKLETVQTEIRELEDAEDPYSEFV